MKYLLHGLAMIGEGVMSIFGNLFGPFYTPEIKTFEDDRDALNNDWLCIRKDFEKVLGDFDEKK